VPTARKDLFFTSIYPQNAGGMEISLIYSGLYKKITRETAGILAGF